MTGNRQSHQDELFTVHILNDDTKQLMLTRLPVFTSKVLIFPVSNCVTATKAQATKSRKTHTATVCPPKKRKMVSSKTCTQSAMQRNTERPVIQDNSTTYVIFIKFASFEVQCARGSAALSGSQPQQGVHFQKPQPFKSLFRTGTHITSEYKK